MHSAEKKKLTIMLDADLYRALKQKVPDRRIGAFLGKIIRPHVLPAALDEGYKAMAADTEREQAAAEWLEGELEVPVGENIWRQ